MVKIIDALTIAAHLQAGAPSYHGSRTTQLLTIVVNGIPHLAISPVIADPTQEMPEIHSLHIEFGEVIPTELAASLVASNYLRRETPQ